MTTTICELCLGRCQRLPKERRRRLRVRWSRVPQSIGQSRLARARRNYPSDRSALDMWVASPTRMDSSPPTAVSPTNSSTSCSLRRLYLREQNGAFQQPAGGGRRGGRGVLAGDFDIDVTTTQWVPNADDPAITFPDVTAKRQGVKR